jgi:hypothetical protein
MQVGDVLLAHGGVSPEYSRYSVQAFNDSLSTFMSEPLFRSWWDTTVLVVSDTALAEQIGRLRPAAGHRVAPVGPDSPAAGLRRLPLRHGRQPAGVESARARNGGDRAGSWRVTENWQAAAKVWASTKRCDPDSKLSRAHASSLRAPLAGSSTGCRAEPCPLRGRDRTHASGSGCRFSS